MRQVGPHGGLHESVLALAVACLHGVRPARKWPLFGQRTSRALHMSAVKSSHSLFSARSRHEGKEIMKRDKRHRGLLLGVALFVVVVSGGLARAEETPADLSQDELFGVVIGALKAEDSVVRYSAVRVLPMVSDRAVRDRLVEALDDEYVYARHAAIRGLGMLGDERAIGAIGRYMKTHKDSSLDILVAMDALGMIAKPPAIEHIEAMLRRQERPSNYEATQVRSCATYALGRIGTPEAKRVLTTLMNDPAALVRIGAAANLAFLGDEDARSFLHELQEDGEHADYVRHLLHVVSKQSTQRERSRGLLWTLRHHTLNTPKERKRWETKILDTSQPGVHRGFLMTLYAEFVGKDGGPFLSRLLDDSHRSIRIYAAAALLQLGDLSGIPVLQEEFESPADGLAWIVDELEPVADPVKKPLLLLAYHSEDRLARIAAAGQLYRLALEERLSHR